MLFLEKCLEFISVIDFIRLLKYLNKRQSGFGLVEVLAGLVLLSVIGVAGFSALTTTSKVTEQSNQRVTARSITVSQMDSVLAADYIYSATNSVAEYSFTQPQSGYSVSTLDRSGNRVNDKIYGIPWNLSSSSVYSPGPSDPIDPCLQKITIIISYQNNEIFRLVDFKTNR
jgi:prepilin-type N-terminal cleavage/methylation domain-containing protein